MKFKSALKAGEQGVQIVQGEQAESKCKTQRIR
jgi:hypothetical protein